MVDENTMHPTVFIRADGNAEIGFGHIMRSLAFATHAMKQGPVQLLIRNPDVVAQEACKNYQIPFSDISHIPFEKEAAYLAGITGKESVVFLDGYGFSEEYQRQVKESGCFLVCMDDHHNRFFLADCIINIAELEKPEHVKRRVGSRLVYGLKYALFRPEFHPIKHDSFPKNETLFICFGGGAETIPLIQKTVEAIAHSNIPETAIRVVLNKRLLAEMKTWSTARFPLLPLTYFVNLNAHDMAVLIGNSDLGITSASTISLECRAMGLPLVAGYYTENQHALYSSLMQHAEITGAGDFTNISSEALVGLITSTWLKEPVAEPSLLNPEKIAHQYSRLIQSWFVEMAFSLRLATTSDSDQYLSWANHPDVRRNAIFSEPIPLENHVRWFNARLLSETCVMLVGEWKGIPVGQVRFDEHENMWEISYSVDPDYQGRGFGEMLIRMGMEILYKMKGHPLHIDAVVKSENIASLIVFQKLHFTEESPENRAGIELHRFSFKI